MEPERLQPVPLGTLEGLVGTEVGVSPWRTVTQRTIDAFADATDDHQFIHVDPERAAAETPFGGTIAHGFLVLSLLSPMIHETLPTVEGSTMSINQGFDRLRFSAPVRAGARIRGRFVLSELRIRPSGMVQIGYDVTVEIEGSIKPAIVARWLTIAVMPPRGDA